MYTNPIIYYPDRHNIAGTVLLPDVDVAIGIIWAICSKLILSNYK